MDKILENIKHIEEKYKINYPNISSATYKSLVNYTNDIKKPIQRWYRYKEGYSVDLMQQIFIENNLKKGEIVLDPFCGGGSTNLQAKVNGNPSIGYEINPFSAFIAKVKTQNYSKKDKKNFELALSDIFNKIKKTSPSQKPNLSTIDKLFDKNVLIFLLRMKAYIKKEKGKTGDLLFFVWLSILEDCSNYRKDGNGLKIKKSVKNKINVDFVKSKFLEVAKFICEDLDFAINISSVKNSSKIINKTSLDLKSIKNKEIGGIIFSPPYANCFDYTEIYKIELWMGGFVSDYPDLKKLRKNAVRSHLNGYSTWKELGCTEIDLLSDIIIELQKRKLWDKRIPKMVQAYFEDMFKALKEHYRVLKSGGFDVIIVSNSAYGGMLIPTDILLTLYAEKIGFKIKKIDVARYIITSSQQYNQTKYFRKYLRESIIYLQK